MCRKKIACAIDCARMLAQCLNTKDPLKKTTEGATLNNKMFCGRCDDCCREGCASTQSPHSLGQLHLDLLPDLLPLLVAADGEDVPVLQLLLAGPVPELHGQQFLPDPAGEGPCGEVTVVEGSDMSSVEVTA